MPEGQGAASGCSCNAAVAMSTKAAWLQCGQDQHVPAACTERHGARRQRAATRRLEAVLLIALADVVPQNQMALLPADHGQGLGVWAPRADLWRRHVAHAPVVDHLTACKSDHVASGQPAVTQSCAAWPAATWAHCMQAGLLPGRASALQVQAAVRPHVSARVQ